MKSSSAGHLILAFMAVLLCLLIQTETASGIEEVLVVPERPTSADSVAVIVQGLLVDSCWNLFSTSCAAPATDSLSVIVTLEREGGSCLPMIRDYETHCSFGPLAAGEYSVGVEEWGNPEHTLGPDTAQVRFTVLPATPIVPTTWGYVRAVFR